MLTQRKSFEGFCGSLATKFVSLNNEPCMIRPTLIDLNPVELNYYPFMIVLDKFSKSCSSFDDLSTKICIPSKTKDINIKLFNMIANQSSKIYGGLLNSAHDFISKHITIFNRNAKTVRSIL